MLAGWGRTDGIAVNKTNPPTLIHQILCRKMSNANRRGSAAATTAHGTAPKLCISAERKRKSSESVFSREFPKLPPRAAARRSRHTQNDRQFRRRVINCRRSRAYTSRIPSGSLPHQAPQIPGIPTSAARRGCGFPTHSNRLAVPQPCHKYLSIPPGRAPNAGRRLELV